MDDDAVSLGVSDELIEVLIQMFNDIRTDTMCPLTSLAPIGDGFECKGFAFESAFGVVV